MAWFDNSDYRIHYEEQGRATPSCSFQDGAAASMSSRSDGGGYELLMAALRLSAVRTVVTWGSAGSVPNAPEMADAMSVLIDDPIPPLNGCSAYTKGAYGESNARVMAQSFGKSLRAILEASGGISRSRAANISCPALLITGEYDSLASGAGLRHGGRYPTRRGFRKREAQVMPGITNGLRG
jgi:pimeloyl-ACP methyl ester carboxylesterase